MSYAGGPCSHSIKVNLGEVVKDIAESSRRPWTEHLGQSATASSDVLLNAVNGRISSTHGTRQYTVVINKNCSNNLFKFARTSRLSTACELSTEAFEYTGKMLSYLSRVVRY
jgi:hypothetical protein